MADTWIIMAVFTYDIETGFLIYRFNWTPRIVNTMSPLLRRECWYIGDTETKAIVTVTGCFGLYFPHSVHLPYTPLMPHIGRFLFVVDEETSTPSTRRVIGKGGTKPPSPIK